jgi:hypothetical protein
MPSEMIIIEIAAGVAVNGVGKAITAAIIRMNSPRNRFATGLEAQCQRARVRTFGALEERKNGTHRRRERLAGNRALK